MASFKIIKLFKSPEGDNTANPLIPLIPSHSKQDIYIKGITVRWSSKVQREQKIPQVYAYFMLNSLCAIRQVLQALYSNSNENPESRTIVLDRL